MSLIAEMNELLTELVERYQVCWEIYPHEEMWNGVRVQTGFEIDLFGTHQRGMENPTPGCARCLEVYDALEAIALNVLPEERRPSLYKLSSFDQSLHYSHVRKDRPDVVLTITISHRNNPMAPIDDCELRCVDEIKRKLRHIGAEPRLWYGKKHQTANIQPIASGL